MTDDGYGFFYEEMDEANRSSIDRAIEKAKPIVPGWVTGSYEGSVRPIFGKYRGRNMMPNSALAEALGFPKLTAFQIFRLINVPGLEYVNGYLREKESGK